jgi:threonine dehydratase
MKTPLPDALPVTFFDVLAAAERIEGAVVRTPCLRSETLSRIAKADVWVKFENLQFTASFKERGALNTLLLLKGEERRRGVIAMSAGNHAQGVAYHAGRLAIVMPSFTPNTKVKHTRDHGARVVLIGDTLSEAATEAHRLADAENLVFVHPYDDPRIIAGQGTIAIEMLDERPDLDCLIVPIGGGGLISGNAIAAKAINPQIEVVGVEAELYPSMWNALHGEDRPCGGATLAEGIAVKNVGKLTLPIIRELVSDVLLVSESQLERAVNAYLTLQKTMAEGAGAAGLAAMLKEPQRFKGRRVGLILCGGNIDPRILASIMVRELERGEQIVSFRLTIPDRPGVLGQIASRLGELGANILEVDHKRLFLDVPAKGARLDVTVETRDHAHAEEIMAALAADGYQPVRIQASDVMG